MRREQPERKTNQLASQEDARGVRGGSNNRGTRRKVQRIGERSAALDWPIYFTEDGRRKVNCPECGLPRDPEYAKRALCSCCGHWGLERNQRVEEDATEVFTEDGQLMVLDRPAKREQPKAEPKVDKKKVEAITADLFLVALF